MRTLFFCVQLAIELGNYKSRILLCFDIAFWLFTMKYFPEFDEMLNFMLMAVRWNLKANWTNGTTEAATNQTTEATSEAIPLLQYLLQCETRQSFLQELLTRIATLKRRYPVK